MLKGEDRLEYERQLFFHGTAALIAVLTIVGCFAYLAVLAFQYFRAQRSLLDLPGGPLYVALLAILAYSDSKRRLRRLEEIKKAAEPNQPPVPTRGNGT
jgi:hypothetical protein